jgi:hypothetical protein
MDNSSNQDTSERDDKVFEDSFKNARKEISQKGFDTTIYKEFPDCHGLKHHNLWHNGRATKTRLIEYKDRFVTTTGRTYEVLPNEKVIEIVEEALLEHRDWNLTPDQSHSEGNWHVQNGNLVMSKETSTKPTGTSMLARYRFPQDIDPTGDGRTLHLGICLGNSIDLTQGFAVIPYHFRSGCMNSMYHVRASVMHKEGSIQWTGAGSLVKDWGTDSDLQIAQENIRLEEGHIHDVADDNKRLGQRIRHTSKLDKDFVIGQIDHGMNVVSTMGERYKELSRLKVSKLTAEQIVNSFPETAVLEDLVGLSFSHEKDKDGNLTGKNIPEITKPQTNWQMYNQITDKLSHGGLVFNSTLKHMGTLDKIFQVWQ